MTPEAQRVAIAEYCGYKDIALRLIGDEQSICMHEWCSGIVGQGGVSIPDYLNDLNAMHRAVQLLTTEQRDIYRQQLAAPFAGPRGSGEWYEGYDYAIDTLADQRAKAFLRAINKWDESK